MHSLLLAAVLALGQFDEASPLVAASLDMIGPVGPPSGDWEPLGSYTIRKTFLVDDNAYHFPPLDIYAPTWCAGCKLAVKDLTENSIVDVKIHTDSKSFPEKIKELIAQGGVYPVVLWHSETGREFHISDGWRGFAEFLIRYDKSRAPVNVRTPAVKQVAQAGGRVMGSYPVHGVTWHIKGSSETREELIEHLSNDGIHRGKFDHAWLQSLSRSQLQTIHDDDHRGVAMQQTQTAATVPTVQYQQPTVQYQQLRPAQMRRLRRSG